MSLSSSEDQLRTAFRHMTEASRERDDAFHARKQELQYYYGTFLSGHTSTLDIVEHLRHQKRLFQPPQGIDDFETLSLEVAMPSQEEALERDTDPLSIDDLQQCRSVYTSPVDVDVQHLLNASTINHWTRCKARPQIIRVSVLNSLTLLSCESTSSQPRIECDATLDDRTAMCFSPCQGN